MILKSISLFASAFLFVLAIPAHAQWVGDDPVWKESDVPSPPAFDVGKLLTFEVSSASSLVYGVDPATISITQTDGVVRYVIVALSASGASNTMYEGIRCSTGEFKTYARYSADGRWIPVSSAEWRTMFGNMPSKHALRFAKAGACDHTTPVSSVKELVNQLKNSNSRTSQ